MRQRWNSSVGIPVLAFKRGILVISYPFHTLAFHTYKYITIFPFWTTLDHQETSFLHHAFSLHFLFYLNLTSRLPSPNHSFLLIFSTNLFSHFPFDSTYLDTSSSSTLYTRSIKGKERIKLTKRDPWVIS